MHHSTRCVDVRTTQDVWNNIKLKAMDVFDPDTKARWEKFGDFGFGGDLGDG